MRVFLGLGTRAPHSRETAHACLGANLALPGFGSLAAGRKVGYFQAALAITGVTLSAIFMVRFAAWYFANKATLDGEVMDPVEALLLIWRAARMCLAGIGIFVLAWLWALGTSLRILSAAKDPPPLAKPDSRCDSVRRAR